MFNAKKPCLLINLDGSIHPYQPMEQPQFEITYYERFKPGTNMVMRKRQYVFKGDTYCYNIMEQV